MDVVIPPLIAGNWKMNGLAASLAETAALARALARQPSPARIAVCPPATLIHRMAQSLAGTPVLVGGQDCHAEACGAYTGDICAEMLADAGARLVIVGHSERRAYHGETDEMVALKAAAALRAGLEPIVCLGETLEERRAGWAMDVVTRQARESVPTVLAGHPFSVAYEPVWAIGSGQIPTIDEIEQVHAAIRMVLADRLGETGLVAPILYGGSVKPSNACQILAAREVGGALVGGASLKAADFMQIIRAAE
ncbi:MAG: triose-phosphate isomerase [Caulobacteraceae bacterium]